MHAALPAVLMPAAVQALAAVLAVAAVTASPADALKPDTDSVMDSGLWRPEMRQWTLGAVEEANVALVQQQESAACGRGGPTALAAARVGRSGHAHSGLVPVRKCFELASAEQALAVHGGEHVVGPVAAVPIAAGLGAAGPTAAGLTAVLVAALPADLAADQQLLAPQLYLLQSGTNQEPRSTE